MNPNPDTHEQDDAIATCYRHPDRPTGLRCVRCDRPICTECAHHGPTGYRCADCTVSLRERHYTEQRYINPLRVVMEPPLVSYILLALIVAIFGLELAAGVLNDPAILVQFGAMYGPSILLEGEVWRLLTAMFVHVDIMHILFNGFALYLLGPGIEQIYGRSRFLIIYLISGLFGSLASFGFRGFMVFAAGASGAIFGIAGLTLAFFVAHRKGLGAAGKAYRDRMLRLIGINLVFGLLIPGIDNLAHMGGLVAGFVLGYLLAPRYKPAVSPTGQSGVIDEASLRRRWYVVAGALLLLSICVFGAFSYWMGTVGLPPLS